MATEQDAIQQLCEHQELEKYRKLIKWTKRDNEWDLKVLGRLIGQVWPNMAKPGKWSYAPIASFASVDSAKEARAAVEQHYDLPKCTVEE